MMKLALFLSLLIHLIGGWLFYTTRERPRLQEEHTAKLLPSVVTEEQQQPLPDEAYPPLTRVPHDL